LEQVRTFETRFIFSTEIFFYHFMIEFNFALLKACLAEFLCTFIFMFVICGNRLNEVRANLDRTIGTGAIAAGLSTAFVAISIIYAFGDVSGAHFNPAVTIGAMAGGKIGFIKGSIYVVAQLLASIFAMSLLIGVYGFGSANDLLVIPSSKSNNMQSICMEFLLTFVLVFIIYACAMGVKAPTTKVVKELELDEEAQKEHEADTVTTDVKMHFAPIAIGLTLGALCFIGATVSGGAFNPARAMGAAMLAHDYSNVWIYWIGDVSGGVVAALLHTHFFARD